MEPLGWGLTGHQQEQGMAAVLGGWQLVLAARTGPTQEGEGKQQQQHKRRGVAGQQQGCKRKVEEEQQEGQQELGLWYRIGWQRDVVRSK
jgi:hypothetical protein